MTATDRARLLTGQRPPRPDRQRIDTLLDALAWQTHLTRTCQHVIDQLRGQVETLTAALVTYERTDLATVRNKHLGSSK